MTPDLQYPKENTEHCNSGISLSECLDEQLVTKAYSDSSGCSVESPSLDLVGTWITDGEKSIQFRTAMDKAKVPLL